MYSIYKKDKNQMIFQVPLLPSPEALGRDTEFGALLLVLIPVAMMGWREAGRQSASLFEAHLGSLRSAYICIGSCSFSLSLFLRRRE